ncbi:hypothetical protein BKI49_00950 [Streptomyces sp. Tue6028]|uniref:hypothetical protein n=1 Tax=Streptomyces sp. Tue6028 TaxID=2036037 RepID=UPI000BD439A0|nr:hypothetical protein [Streptomyces sp. Tue6028]PBC65847.1 hypothetical protein BKI49_00950 [Streptomyces sp. Tue6028]
MDLLLEADADSDQEELDALTRQLRERLLELEIERAELNRSGAVPGRAKPGEAIAVGALAVTAAPVVLRSVVQTVVSWLGNRPVRTAGISIGDDRLELRGVSSDGQRALIDAFLARHDAPPSASADPAPGATSASGSGPAQGPEPTPDGLADR